VYRIRYNSRTQRAVARRNERVNVRPSEISYTVRGGGGGSKGVEKPVASETVQTTRTQPIATRKRGQGFKKRPE
jgi:hypothetical protein